MISERIKQVIDNEKISVREFERRISSGQGVIAKVLKKQTDISVKVLISIKEKFPQYSAEWLLTGEGDMYVTGKSPKEDGSDANSLEQRLAEIEKKHNTRYCAISTQIEDLIKRLGIMKYNQSYYIFSDPETMSPGSNKIYDSKFTKEWDKLRKALGLPSTMQLYSFRDTGIWTMLKSHVDDLSVMQHADHSSLDITTIYANHYDPNLVKIINENTPEF